MCLSMLYPPSLRSRGIGGAWVVELLFILAQGGAFSPCLTIWGEVWACARVPHVTCNNGWIDRYEGFKSEEFDTCVLQLHFALAATSMECNALLFHQKHDKKKTSSEYLWITRCGLAMIADWFWKSYKFMGPEIVRKSRPKTSLDPRPFWPREEGSGE